MPLVGLIKAGSVPVAVGQNVAEDAVPSTLLTECNNSSPASLLILEGPLPSVCPVVAGMPSIRWTGPRLAALSGTRTLGNFTPSTLYWYSTSGKLALPPSLSPLPGDHL